MKTVVILVALSLAAGLAAQEAKAPRLRCPLDYLDVPALEAMLAAQDLKALEAVYAGVLVPDSVTRMIYASRTATVAPGRRADLLVIEAMPHTRLEFDLLASLADPDLKIHARVAHIAAGNWLDQALAAVVRQEMGAKDFLMQSVLAQDHPEIGSLLPGMEDTLRKWKPQLFAAAYASIPETARRLIDAGLRDRGSREERYNMDIVIAPIDAVGSPPRRLGAVAASPGCAPGSSARTVREALGETARRIRIDAYDRRLWKSPEEVERYVRRILDARPEGGALSPHVYWAESAGAEIAGWIDHSPGEQARLELGNGYVYLQGSSGCPFWGRYLGPDRTGWVVRPEEVH